MKKQNYVQFVVDFAIAKLLSESSGKYSLTCCAPLNIIRVYFGRPQQGSFCK